MSQFPSPNKWSINSEAGDTIQQIALNGKPSVDVLFPNTGLSNMTIKELIPYTLCLPAGIWMSNRTEDREGRPTNETKDQRA